MLKTFRKVMGNMDGKTALFLCSVILLTFYSLVFGHFYGEAYLNSKQGYYSSQNRVLTQYKNNRESTLNNRYSVLGTRAAEARSKRIRKEKAERERQEKLEREKKDQLWEQMKKNPNQLKKIAQSALNRYAKKCSDGYWYFSNPDHEYSVRRREVTIVRTKDKSIILSPPNRWNHFTEFDIGEADRLDIWIGLNNYEKYSYRKGWKTYNEPYYELFWLNLDLTTNGLKREPDDEFSFWLSPADEITCEQINKVIANNEQDRK